MDIPDLSRRFGTRRFGKVSITSSIYDSFWKSCKFEIIPLSIHYSICRDTFELECFCELFRELEDNDAIPTYNLTFLRINNHIAVEKIEEVI